jgi:hypothetical protein
VALVILQASVIDLLLLEVAASKIAWRSGNHEPFKKIVKVAQCSCERCCARLIRAVKSNSSGIEVWRGSRYWFLLRSSYSCVSPSCWRSVYLIEKIIKGLNPPQPGLRVIGKSLRPREKYCVHLALLFNYLLIIFSRNWIDACHLGLQTYSSFNIRIVLFTCS